MFESIDNDEASGTGNDGRRNKKRWKTGKYDRMAIPIIKNTQMVQKDIMAAMKNFRMKTVSDWTDGLTEKTNRQIYRNSRSCLIGCQL